MATARTLSLGLPLTTTWRNFQAAVVLSLSAVAFGGVIYLIETYALASRHRFVENPSDVMMRAFGLAHFWIGWLFLFTSPRLRSVRSISRLGVLTILGAAWCLIAWHYGGMRNPLLLMTFYAYFIIHEIRDEANLFISSGDAPDDPGRAAFLNRLGISVTLSLITAFAFIYLLHGRIQEKLERVVDEPERWLPWMGGALLVACGVSWLRTWQAVRNHGIRWRDYGPLLAVYGTIAAILLAGSLFGSVGFNLIVLIHVMAWLVFVRQRLANCVPATGLRLWIWLRTTPAGLVALHLAAAAVVLLLMALRVHLWQRVGLISELFATSNFHYWTIMHITMAYWRK